MLAEDNSAVQPASEPHTTSERFRWETELVTMLATRWQPWPGARQSTWLSLTEVRVGAASADLVFIRRQTPRWPRLPPSLTPTEALCLAWLRDSRCARIDLLERLCGVAAGVLRDGALDRLVECGVLARGKGDAIALKRNCSAEIQIVAVEAKLTKWKKALSQARSNMAFADESYVALPASRRSLLQRLTPEFEAAGVGLLFVAKGEFETAIPAAQSPRHSWRREYVYSAAYQLLQETP